MVKLQSPLIDINYKITDQQSNILKNGVEDFLAQMEPMFGQKKGKGKGIVISAGGFKYFTCAYILISMLKEVGCKLKVEVWYYDDELTINMVERLEALGSKCIDMKPYTNGRPHGFLMKPLSILYSNFQEVLFLDADNNCLKDPEYLFYSDEYKKHGALFWPDFWRHSPDNQLWEILGITGLDGPEQESGQLLIDKKKCWKELQLSIYFNWKANDFYKFMYGDKDTYHLAWRYLKKDFFFIPEPPGSAGFIDDSVFHGLTMVQHDPNGNAIFMHRNLLKWDITRNNEKIWNVIKRFKPNAEHKSIEFFSDKGLNNINLVGDVYDEPFEQRHSNFEEICLFHLCNLRKSSFYSAELMSNYTKHYRG